VSAREVARDAHAEVRKQGEIVPRSTETGRKKFFWITSQNRASSDPDVIGIERIVIHPIR